MRRRPRSTFHEAVHIDSVAYQAGEIGFRLRRALTAEIGMASIPQLFVGGAFVGGASEAFDSYRDGSLQAGLNAAGVSWRDKAGFDPYEMLPKWPHPKPPADVQRPMRRPDEAGGAAVRPLLNTASRTGGRVV